MEPCLAQLGDVVGEALAARKPGARPSVARLWKPRIRP
jgi:hypothetical protein